MRGQIEFKDKFYEFLSRKKNPSQAASIIYGSQSQNSNQSNGYLSPTQTQYRNTDNPSSQSSINSSQIAYSQFSKSSCRSQRIQQMQTQSVKRGRLRKLRDIEENVCSICLEPYHNRAQMSCKHSYCKECLEEWLRTSSKCPYCRADCQFYTNNGKYFQIERKELEYQVEEDEGEAGQGQFNYYCYNCDESTEGEDILVCDRCFINACHEGCDPRLRHRRLRRNQQWYCHFCS